MLPEDARDLFNRAVIATGAVSSYRYHMEVGFQASGAGDVGNTVITMEGRYLAPDRNALEMTVSFGFISMNVSTVSIGDDLYTMNPFTGEWSLERIPLLGSASAPWMLIEEDFLEGLSYVGLEELDSGSAHRLSATPDPENAVLDWAGSAPLPWGRVHPGPLLDRSAGPAVPACRDIHDAAGRNGHHPCRHRD